MPLRFSILLCLSVIGCSGQADTPSPPPGASASAPANQEASPEVPCTEMTRHACLRSLLCTLERPERGAYACRAAQGNCEVGLRQVPEDEDRCNDRDGCRFQSAQCYCPCRGAGRSAVPDGSEAELCDCECGGGQPDRCVR